VKPDIADILQKRSNSFGKQAIFPLKKKDELKGKHLLTIYQSMSNQNWETAAVIFVGSLTAKPVIFI
jgi:hypothetical protein